MENTSINNSFDENYEELHSKTIKNSIFSSYLAFTSLAIMPISNTASLLGTSIAVGTMYLNHANFNKKSKLLTINKNNTQNTKINPSKANTLNTFNKFDTEATQQEVSLDIKENIELEQEKIQNNKITELLNKN